MVLVSALSFSLSYKPQTPFMQYGLSRLIRLVAPIWIFLSVYFAAIFFLDPASADLQPRTIFRSYALLDGIGYVWIIRVFLLVALAAPFLFKLHQAQKSHIKYLAILLAAYIPYEMCVYATNNMATGKAFEYASLVIYYLVPYSLLFGYGLRMDGISRKGHIAIFTLASAVFSVIAVYFYIHSGHIVPTQDFKYPPRIYYLSFALIGCEFMWLAGPYVWEQAARIPAVRHAILFIARNSLWIYLWHIPFIKYIDTNFAAKYAVTVACATAITAGQVYIVNRWIIPAFASTAMQKRIRSVFTG